MTTTNKVKERHISKPVLFKLTEKDRSDLGTKVADLAKQKKDLELSFDVVKKAHKDKLNNIKEAMEEIYQKINSGMTSEITDVVERRDFEAGTVSYICDGRVFEERTMSQDEMQLELETLERRPAREAKPTRRGEDPVREVIKMETNRKTKRDIVTEAKRKRDDEEFN